MYLIGAAVTGVFGFVYFALLNTVVPGWIFLAIMLSLILHDLMYGSQAAMIAECSTGRLRYSGASQLASIFAGGPAPLVATALFAQFRSGYAIALRPGLRHHQLCRGFAADRLHRPGHLAGIRQDLNI
jgi:hypothetical protein